MHLRGRVRLGGLLCVLALAALVVSAADAAGPESTHAAASEHGGGGLISLDKSLIVQAVNFVILLLILQRLLYKPFLAKMEERTGAIKRSLEEAQAARAEAAHQVEENATRLRQAHAEAAAIREQALKEAGEEQRRLVESAKAQMDADIRRAREELRREVADLATAVAEKLVRRSLRDEDHRRIVADTISRLGN